MTREEFKSFLTKISANDFKLPENEKATDYLPLMLKYIGDRDSVLRDDLIYSAFCYWISEYRYFTNQELSQLFDTLLTDDYIFFNFGAKGDDSIVKRTFAIIVLPQILDVNLSEKFLSNDQIRHAVNAILHFVNEEKDVRGIDSELNWVHTLAHPADVIHYLANTPGVSADDNKAFLAAMRMRYAEGIEFLAADEYERLAVWLFYDCMLDKCVDAQYLSDWIASLATVGDGKDGTARMKARTNSRNLVRAMYFQITHQNKCAEFLPILTETERKLNSYIYKI